MRVEETSQNSSSSFDGDEKKSDTLEAVEKFEVDLPRDSEALSVSVVGSDSENLAAEHPEIRSAENRIWPFLVQNGVGTLDTFCEVLFFSTADEDGLAASSVIFLLQSIIEVFTDSLLMPTQYLIAQKHVTDKRAAGSIYQQGLLLGTVVTIPAVLLLCSAKPILEQLNYDNNIVNLTTQYALTSSLGILPTKWLDSNVLFLGAIDQEKVIAYWSVIDFSIGVFLKWLFVNQLERGVVGLGIAKSLQAWIGLILLKLYMYRNPSYREYALFSPRIRETISYLKRILQLGLPILSLELLQLPEAIIRNLFIAGLPHSDDSLALDQLISQLFELVNFPVAAVQTACQVTLSQQLENREFDNMRYRGNYTLRQVIGLSFIAGVLITPLNQQLTSLFLDDTDSYGVNLTELFIIASAGNIVTNITDTVQSNFYALNDTLWPSMWLIVASFTYLAVAKFIGFPLANDLRGLYVSNIVVITLLNAMLIHRWNKRDFTIYANLQQSTQGCVSIGSCCFRLFGRDGGVNQNPTNSVTEEKKGNQNGYEELVADERSLSP